MLSMKMLVLFDSRKAKKQGKKQKREKKEKSISVYPAKRQLTPLSDFCTSSEKHKTDD